MPSVVTEFTPISGDVVLTTGMFQDYFLVPHPFIVPNQFHWVSEFITAIIFLKVCIYSAP